MAVGSVRTLSRNVAAAGLALLTLAVICAGGAEQRRIESVSSALACAQAALGGSQALSALSSLAITLEITPDPSNRKGRPSTSEIVLGFPDKFKSTSRMPLPGRGDVVLVQGFSGDRELVGPADDETRMMGQPNEASLRLRRHEFARWALMLLLRETPVTRLTWSPDLAPEGSHLRVAATGPDGFNMALLLDKATCQPVAAMWERPPNFGDEMSGRTPVGGRHVERRDLLDYDTFDGIRLPRRIRTATDGVTRSELRVTSARVNPPLPDDLLNPPRRMTGSSKAGR